MPVPIHYGDPRFPQEENSSQPQTMMGDSLSHSQSHMFLSDSILQYASHHDLSYPSSKEIMLSQAESHAPYYFNTNAMPYAPMKYQPHQYNHTEWNTSLESYRDLRYDSPSGPYGGTLSDASSEYTLSPASTRLSFTFNNSQPESFQFAPLPADLHSGQQTLWTAGQDFTPLTTNMDPTFSGMQAIAMKELEVESSTDLNLDQQSLEDRIGRVQIHRPFQQPEELDLSESIPASTSSSRSTTMSSQATDMSDEDAISSIHDHESDSDFNPNRRRNSGKYLSTAQSQSRGHVRSNSNLSTRSPRNQQSTHSVLDPSSRVHKTRAPRSSATSHASSKEKARFKTSSSKIGNAGRGSGEKQQKYFPCAFHQFGCSISFANKNEWKRHVYSQHLQLGFYRCDLGQCNPDYNPKLYVSADKGQRNARSNEQGDSQEEEREVIYNDFNRKDLFTQHCRRMHGPARYAEDNTTLTNQRINARFQRQSATAAGQTTSTKTKHRVSVTKEDEAAFEVELETIRSRCRLIRRKAPSRSSCGFCNRLFLAESYESTAATATTNEQIDDSGKAEEKAWEERMEHIGRHYERDGCSTQLETIDDDLVDWGLEVGVLENVVDNLGNTKAWLVGYEVRDLTTGLKGDDDDYDQEELRFGFKSEDVDQYRRKGLRNRDRKSSSSRSRSRYHDHLITTSIKMEKQPQIKKEPIFDSEDDASAEDE